jgi:hypothetical protein
MDKYNIYTSTGTFLYLNNYSMIHTYYTMLTSNQLKFMCIRGKTGERLGNFTFIPIVKPHIHQLYILRHCTNIVYLFSLRFILIKKNSITITAWSTLIILCWLATNYNNPVLIMDTLILSQPAKRKMCDIFKYSRLNVKKIILGKGKMIQR